MISKEALEKFKDLYKERFGKDLDDAEAFGKASKLLNLVSIVYRPIQKEWIRGEKREN
ncbi:MAG: hypothetical protein KGI50_01550 [Patescibacteria group bacterium]|nr:hypothetical protein [Patescibacteria group bacterium]MDE2437972.1 hypothetical protein [Patescibacteria group bacterium]